MIEIDQLTVSYGETAAVRGLSLSVAKGELVVLLGSSGCGKTTLLKSINALITPMAGAVRINGEDVQAVPGHELRRRIGYVFQGIGLFPHLTVGENVAVVPRLVGWSAERTSERIAEMLELVGLPASDYAERMPGELSGGQRQRVGVARALAAQPGVMLMDEPFGALDPITRDELQREVRALHDRLGLTTVLVTHDMTEALLMADRIAVMRGGEIVQLGTPGELLASPADGYVEQLMQTPKRQADRIEALAESVVASRAKSQAAEGGES